MELIFGTASFQDGYGVSNSNTIVSSARKIALLNNVIERGINHLDMATSYEGVENLISSLSGERRDFSVSTKLSDEEFSNVTDLKRAIESKLEKLKINNFKVLYVHNESMLMINSHLNSMNQLLMLRDQGYFQYLGASIYTLESLKKIYSKYTFIDVFQVPENICDRRLRNEPIMSELRSRGKVIYVRSIFLQGLLIMGSQNVPRQLEKARLAVKSLEHYSKKIGRSVAEICFQYAKQLSWSSGTILGATDERQLNYLDSNDFSLPLDWENDIDMVPFTIKDPRLWNSTT
jgi:aryl-alcohol dehydrogenase-like predicted oxidoreductase